MALSYEQTGKYTSERHEQAKRDGKLTAGQAAKVVSSLLGMKVTAKEVVAAYTAIYGEPEWHHAGFYGDGKKRMGRTYFFTREQLENLVRNWDEAMTMISNKEVAGNEVVRGVYYEWTREYGRYGRRVNCKVLCTYEGPRSQAPKTFIELSDNGFENAKKHISKRYYGWDSPSREEFES